MATLRQLRRDLELDLFGFVEILQGEIPRWITTNENGWIDDGFSTIFRMSDGDGFGGGLTGFLSGAGVKSGLGDSDGSCL